MSAFSFLIVALAVWRISSMLARERGPFEVFDKIRHVIGVRYDTKSNAYGENELAKGALCVWCSSMWFAILFTLLYLLVGDILVCVLSPFAISAFAIVIEEVASNVSS